MTEKEAKPQSIPDIITMPIRVEKIHKNPLNPRRVFLDKDIDKLCKSIVEMGGIIVPIVVFEKDKDNYELLDGERRLIAARKLGMKEIQANVIPKRLSLSTVDGPLLMP